MNRKYKTLNKESHNLKRTKLTPTRQKTTKQTRTKGTKHPNKTKYL
jgi:hypothetical protein